MKLSIVSRTGGRIILRHVLVLSVLFICAASGCAVDEHRSEDRQIRDLVDNIVAAHGGRDALRQITGYIATGKLHATHRNALIKTTRWFRRPDCLLLELDYQDQPEWRLTLGRQSWKGPSRTGLQTASGPVVWSMRLQTARFDLPLRLLEHEADLVLLAPDEEGRQVLRHELDEGLRMDYHIDPESHFVVKVTMGMDGPPAMEFEADYGGYREVAGVMLPHREVTRTGGTVTSKVVIDSFVINPPELADMLLPPPGSVI